MEEVKEKTMIEKAEAAAARLEVANTKAEELLARQIISGHAAAGKPEEKKEEESAQDYTKRVMGGQA